MRFLYGFFHNGREVEFGPYSNLSEAQDAFQRVYGYWPLDPTYVERYV